MKQFHYFNSNDLLTKFIKSLVSSTNLPLIDYWKPGKPIKEGCFYLTENYIIRCKQSDNGIFNLEKNQYNADSIYNSDYFELVSPYVAGEAYRSFTGKFESKYQWYDAETHKYLGKYLRMLRDFKNINLMHLYNCISPIEYNSIRFNAVVNLSEQLENRKYNLYKPELNTKFSGDDGYKVITCPILYNQDYTIYIDSNLPIKLASIYFNGINAVVPTIINNEVISKSYTNFNSPILYRCNENVQDTSNSSLYRNLLTLLIQVPKNCNNIVVLEGNYTNLHVFTEKDGNTLTKRIEGDNYNFNDLTNSDMDKICITSSNLIRSMSNELHAFDLDLLPFLLNHVIDLNDDIPENIERIQECISSYDFYKIYGVRYTKPYSKGIWDNNLRKFIYDLMTTGTKKGDIVLINKKVNNVTGYIDKDVESVINEVTVNAI